jgi:hypothetical protein
VSVGGECREVVPLPCNLNTHAGFAPPRTGAAAVWRGSVEPARRASGPHARAKARVGHPRWVAGPAWALESGNLP